MMMSEPGPWSGAATSPRSGTRPAKGKKKPARASGRKAASASSTDDGAPKATARRARPGKVRSSRTVDSDNSAYSGASSPVMALEAAEQSVLATGEAPLTAVGMGDNRTLANARLASSSKFTRDAERFAIASPALTMQETPVARMQAAPGTAVATATAASRMAARRRERQVQRAEGLAGIEGLKPATVTPQGRAPRKMKEELAMMRERREQRERRLMEQLEALSKASQSGASPSAVAQALDSSRGTPQPLPPPSTPQIKSPTRKKQMRMSTPRFSRPSIVDALSHGVSPTAVEGLLPAARNSSMSFLPTPARGSMALVPWGTGGQTPTNARLKGSLVAPRAGDILSNQLRTNDVLRALGDVGTSMSFEGLSGLFHGGIETAMVAHRPELGASSRGSRDYIRPGDEINLVLDLGRHQTRHRLRQWLASEGRVRAALQANITNHANPLDSLVTPPSLRADPCCSLCHGCSMIMSDCSLTGHPLTTSAGCAGARAASGAAPCCACGPHGRAIPVTVGRRRRNAINRGCVAASRSHTSWRPQRCYVHNGCLVEHASISNAPRDPGAIAQSRTADQP